MKIQYFQFFLFDKGKHRKFDFATVNFNIWNEPLLSPTSGAKILISLYVRIVNDCMRFCHTYI